MRHLFIIHLFLIASVNASAQKTLLPKPKEISYGEGKFSLNSINIGFVHSPESEDLRVAKEFSTILESISNSNVPVFDKPNKKVSILFERTGDVDPLPVPGEESGPNSREAYKIKIGTKQIKVTAKSSAGLFYAVQTLRQMVEGTGENAFLPASEISDWPSLAYRGFMMDMSHTQLPRIEEIKNQIDFLSRWKTNQYYFYSEASIELDGYPLLVADGRYSRDEVKEIIAYAETKFIDVIPNMELYGHIHDLFRLEHYSDLSVMPHGGEFKPDDPRVLVIVEDWISQIAALFPSPFFHIGFDETWLIKEGAKKLNTTPDQLYIKMLSQITDIVEAQGKITMVWADMLQKYPHVIPQVSKNTIAVPWHYFPKYEEKYDPLLKPFKDVGIDMVIQSALINWNWVYPSFETSFSNTDLLIKVGNKHGVVGFINSGWTDDTQTIMRMNFPDFAYGSAAAWQAEPMDRDNFFKNYTRVLYSPEMAEEVEMALQYLKEGETIIQNIVGWTDVAIFSNPFTAKSLRLIEKNREQLREGRLAVEKAQRHILSALKFGIDTNTIKAILTGAKMLDFIALKYIYAGEIAEIWELVGKADKDEIDGILHILNREVSHKYHTKSSDMMDAIVVLKGLLKEVWLNEYEPYRLEIGLAKYDIELEYWLKLQRRLEAIRLNYDANKELPSLESLFE